MLIVTSESRVLTTERNVRNGRVLETTRPLEVVRSRRVGASSRSHAGQRFHVNRDDPVGLALISKKRLRVRRKVQRSTRV